MLCSWLLFSLVTRCLSVEAALLSIFHSLVFSSGLGGLAGMVAHVDAFMLQMILRQSG
jgi:hypothetical protein